MQVGEPQDMLGRRLAGRYHARLELCALLHKQAACLSDYLPQLAWINYHCTHYVCASMRRQYKQIHGSN